MRVMDVIDLTPCCAWLGKSISIRGMQKCMEYLALWSREFFLDVASRIRIV